MIPDGFVNSLVLYAQAKGATAKLAIETELDALFAKVNAGDGSQLITASVNGKNFSKQINMTVQEKFTAYSEALREINGDKITRTYADFSRVQL